jgi:hypothetical protein
VRVVLVVLFAASCAGDPDDSDPVEVAAAPTCGWLRYEDGRTWTFAERQDGETVETVDNTDGAVTWERRTSYEGSLSSHTIYQGRCDGEGFHLSTASVTYYDRNGTVEHVIDGTYDPELRWLPAEGAVGDVFEDTLYGMIATDGGDPVPYEVPQRVEVLSQEPLTVPAGTFDAFLLERTDPIGQAVRHWIAPDVGMVAEAVYDDVAGWQTERELASAP